MELILKQTSHYIEMSYDNYIHCLSKNHDWVLADNKDSSATTTTAAASVETLTPENDPHLLQQKDLSHVPISFDLLFHYSPKRIVPIPSDSIECMYKETGPKEDVVAHKVWEDKTGFAYQTLLGELMYPYITCWPDIGYSSTTLSKFSCVPA